MIHREIAGMSEVENVSNFYSVINSEIYMDMMSVVCYIFCQLSEINYR